MNVDKILDTIPPKGTSLKEHLKNVYIKTGEYIKKNAEILSSDVSDNIESIELNIKFDNDYVKLEKKINYIVTEE